MMQLKVKALKKIDIVTVSGRMDSATAPEFDNALKGLQLEGRHKIVLDFAGLDYMSSAGLRAMVAALKEAKAHNGSVLVAAANDKIRDTIALVGFQSLFPVFDDILEAVDSL
ncbi:MAG TPA: STAS domain-containing protein [Thermoflexales bacterium]|jgi:anti-anti-sigma factor|nr:STAS domain-containing protein [Thermoflexales bacterium]HQV29196.1 STAS domain-containing protein [Thermoflexales bacterium]HQX09203.1 STAS domain-containing protein [Thermoflexales bacterium]HQY25664.1 STAS domain-containing protein [Thermoflexales bacterium]HQZ51814.1 STAS domain-containing protein [Thermoflexales bacterium]